MKFQEMIRLEDEEAPEDFMRMMDNSKEKATKLLQEMRQQMKYWEARLQDVIV